MTWASFQTTYEELKPGTVHHLERGENRFQTTYEELKPPSRKPG